MFAISRISSCVLVQAIMQNPLLSDYVKKGDHGWAQSFQKLRRKYDAGNLRFMIRIGGISGWEDLHGSCSDSDCSDRGGFGADAEEECFGDNDHEQTV